jgi:hypothetical protein
MLAVAGAAVPAVEVAAPVEVAAAEAAEAEAAEAEAAEAAVVEAAVVEAAAVAEAVQEVAASLADRHPHSAVLWNRWTRHRNPQPTSAPRAQTIRQAVLPVRCSPDINACPHRRFRIPTSALPWCRGRAPQ